MPRGKLIVQAGKPLQFVAAEEDDSEVDETASRIGDTLTAYTRAGAELLTGRYLYLADSAPRHLRKRGDITVLNCKDGVIVRYDPPGEEKGRVRTAGMESTLAEMAPIISDRYLHLDKAPEEILPTECPQLNFALKDASGATRQSMTMAVVLIARSIVPDGFVQSRPPARPIPLVSVQDEIDLQLQGHSEDANPAPRAVVENQRFVAHSRMRLPVAWLAIEIYPPLSADYWQPAATPVWAELDILAAAARRNLQLSELNALDSRVDARDFYEKLLDEFKGLLEGPEEPVHQFLKSHPLLISPTCDRYWSKLPFGDRISDFVFREPYNEYELVELEAPIRAMFRSDGQQRQELTHAINQILDWLQYIEDNKEKVENELGLTGMSTSPRSLIVIGRSDTLNSGDRRKLVTIQNQIPRLRIITYDDLLDGARATIERILGPLGLRGQNARIYFFNK